MCVYLPDIMVTLYVCIPTRYIGHTLCVYTYLEVLHSQVHVVMLMFPIAILPYVEHLRIQHLGYDI